MGRIFYVGNTGRDEKLRKSRKQPTKGVCTEVVKLKEKK